MLETIFISVVVSAVVWGIIWNGSRILKGTRFSSYLGKSPQKNNIGNVYTSPSICPMGNPIVGGLLDKLPAQAEKDEFAELLEEVEAREKSKIIFINHRSSSSSLMGLTLPFGESYTTLSQKDAIKIIDILRDVPDDITIDLILNTTGGSVTAAEIIINALHNHSGRVRVYIPHYAQSAGLLIALTGNDIYLGKNAFVSPVDPQLGYGISAASVKRFCDKHGDDPNGGWVGDFIKLISGEAQSSIKRIYDLIKKILIRKSQGESIEEVQVELASGKYNHCKPLFFQDLNQIIRSVHPSIPADIFRLFELHNEK